ncbi:hypothetical protein GWI33_022140 [Rhynchophorus ferrugineus]|uniref:Uncharacterized protein n=1 Tax=Rhynchophorus ferrugineus TaxID=354439 RepID=A0A834I7Z7_RHYFE|nr:hypothetical protein GWI33_012628 [Rhynchophorus ferrugineus]KAF7284352.1 hypothetical protein GWI33_022140 [Rhynchophorus ferrugineus]
MQITETVGVSGDDDARDDRWGWRRWRGTGVTSRLMSTAVFTAAAHVQTIGERFSVHFYESTPMADEVLYRTVAS